MESRSELSVTPLLRDVALESDAPDTEDPLAAALAEAGLGPNAKSVGSTPVRNVVDPILSPSEDIPLLMDVIAVDPTPEDAPAPVGNEIPEVNSVIALPEKLSAAVEQALGTRSERAPALELHSEAAPPLSLAESPPMTPATEPSLSMPLGFADAHDGADISPTPADDENTEGTEVLDDAALLALLNSPTQPSSPKTTSDSSEVPLDIALGHGEEKPGVDSIPEGEPLDFSSTAPPLENVDAPTSQLIARLKLVEQDMPELSLPSIPLTPVNQAVESSLTLQETPEPPAPSSARPPAATNEFDGPVNAAAQSIAGELQQQLYRKIDSLILETVDSFTRDLNSQLGARIEAMVMAAIDDTLPPLLEQLSAGLHSELRPKLQSKVPELLAEVMNRRR